jgi:hypothetical protein
MHEKENSSLCANRLSRRALLLQMAGMGTWSLFNHPKLFCLPTAAQEQRTHAHPAPAPTSLSQDDDQFLEEIEKVNFRYFWEQASPQTGLIKDRCNVLGNDTAGVASIAATGFGLTALCIGQKRGFVSLPDARERALATLRFLWKTMPTHR